MFSLCLCGIPQSTPISTEIDPEIAMCLCVCTQRQTDDLFIRLVYCVSHHNHKHDKSVVKLNNR